MDWSSIIVAVVVALGSLVGNFIANSKTTVLIGYRIDQLEKKVEKHNSVVERTFKLERDTNTAFMRIDDERADVEELKRELHDHIAKG